MTKRSIIIGAVILIAVLPLILLNSNFLNGILQTNLVNPLLKSKFISPVAGYTKIQPDTGSNATTVIGKVTDKNFAEFLGHFKPATLPFKLSPDTITFADWPDMSDDVINAFDINWQDAQNDDGNYSDDILDQVGDKIQVQKPKYYYAIFDPQKPFVTVMYLYKFYDDVNAQKVLYVVLSTYGLDGKKISTIETAAYTVIPNISTDPKVKLLGDQSSTIAVTIDPNDKITLFFTKTYSPLPGEMDTTNLAQLSTYYQISPTGQIQANDTTQKVKRDE